MSDESQPRKDSTVGCAQVFLFGVLAVLLILSVNFIIRELSGSTTTAAALRVNLSCPVAAYQREAEPLIDQLVTKLDATDLSNRRDMGELRATARILQQQADQIRVPDCLALKHETLVFTFVHTERAMEAMMGGDTSEATIALSRATLNLERFADWSVDVGN